jgi:hypothetical protein
MRAPILRKRNMSDGKALETVEGVSDLEVAAQTG